MWALYKWNIIIIILYQRICDAREDNVMILEYWKTSGEHQIQLQVIFGVLIYMGIMISS